MSLKSRSYSECLLINTTWRVGGGDYLNQTECSSGRHRTGLRYRAGNGIFCCGAELVSFALIREQRPHSQRKLADMCLTSRSDLHGPMKRRGCTVADAMGSWNEVLKQRLPFVTITTPGMKAYSMARRRRRVFTRAYMRWIWQKCASDARPTFRPT